MIVYVTMTSLLSIKSINTYNFERKIILGFPTFRNKNRDKFAPHEINTGILLLNLVEIRK